MTDLREKVRGIVACAKDDMVSLDDATDAIMAHFSDALAAQGGVKVKELERQVEIEKAGLAISKLDPSDLDEGSWKVEAEAALEAVGYFDLRAKLDALVEAGE